MAPRLINFALYQAGWIACVLGAANGWGGRGALGALALVLVHLGLVRERGRELRLLVAAGLLGAALDSILVRAGALRFAADGPLPGFAPGWIVVMWIQFATLLRHALSWLVRRRAWLPLAGAVGGPLAYLSGERLGAAGFGWATGPALIAVALAWAAALPALGALAGREPGAYRGLAGPDGSGQS